MALIPPFASTAPTDRTPTTAHATTAHATTKESTMRTTDARTDRSTARSALRTLAHLVTVVAVAAAISACDMAEPLIDAIGSNLHTLTVVNHCLGDDATVSVYVNGAYAGDVFYQRTFTVMTGPVSLTAYGTGRYGGTFSNSTRATGDLVWTLCPVRRSDASDSDALDHVEPQEDGGEPGEH